MKYADVDKELARKCCKQHSYRAKNGKVICKCETCPLERTKTDKNGQQRHLFCWYILIKLYEIFDVEYNEIANEEIDKITEWINWKEAQDTVNE